MPVAAHIWLKMAANTRQETQNATQQGRMKPKRTNFRRLVNLFSGAYKNESMELDNIPFSH